MPWSETCRMDERARFVRDAFSECFTMTELCERYGISRKTAYKWIERYQDGGRPGCADEFRRIYNEERPHHALGMQTPGSLYTPSERVYPGKAPDPVYPPHFEKRRITKIGGFSWHRQQIFVTEALRNETLGFEWVADRLWSVFFGDVVLGRFDEENSQFLAGMDR